MICIIAVNLSIDVCLLGRIKEVRYQGKYILILLYNIVEFPEVDT